MRSPDTAEPPLPAAVELRRQLHAHPELAGAERITAGAIARWLSTCRPDHLRRQIGGTGVLAVYDSHRGGETVILRAELDALPITEESSLPHRSLRSGVAHLCGHDGHMSILAALARRLAERPPQRGRVALLFQPAEETGEGARRVLEDPRFATLRPDWVLALHNLPGKPLAEVLVREGATACGSTGLVGVLRGRTAHAAHPEEGRSPASALSRLIERLGSLATREDHGGHLAMSTVVHARLGDVAFGTCPGEATIMATLRSDQDHVLSALQQAAEREVAEQANRENLSWQTSITDTFPVTVNHPDAVALVWEAAVSSGLQVSTPPDPLRWSEDFAWYGRVARTALFGLGAGEDHPPLHSPCFDFPDALLEPGVTLLDAIVRRLTGE